MTTRLTQRRSVVHRSRSRPGRRKSCGSRSAAQNGEHTDRGWAKWSVAVSWLAMSRCRLRAHWETIDKMTRDITLALHALSYVIRLHADLTSEHGAPTLGTQNQAVDFILADPELIRAVAAWAAMPNIGEASTKPYQRLPHDELYRRVREYLEKISSGPTS